MIDLNDMTPGPEAEEQAGTHDAADEFDTVSLDALDDPGAIPADGTSWTTGKDVVDGDEDEDETYAAYDDDDDDDDADDDDDDVGFYYEDDEVFDDDDDDLDDDDL
ncbi:MAG: hypothetical protein AAF432_03185 [Planctomycetota bacterium]